MAPRIGLLGPVDLVVPKNPPPQVRAGQIPEEETKPPSPPTTKIKHCITSGDRFAVLCCEIAKDGVSGEAVRQRLVSHGTGGRQLVVLGRQTGKHPSQLGEIAESDRIDPEPKVIRHVGEQLEWLLSRRDAQALDKLGGVGGVSGRRIGESSDSGFKTPLGLRCDEASCSSDGSSECLTGLVSEISHTGMMTQNLARIPKRRAQD